MDALPVGWLVPRLFAALVKLAVLNPTIASAPSIPFATIWRRISTLRHHPVKFRKVATPGTSASAKWFANEVLVALPVKAV
jgi:hypothetical protein